MKSRSVNKVSATGEELDEEADEKTDDSRPSWWKKKLRRMQKLNRRCRRGCRRLSTFLAFTFQFIHCSHCFCELNND